MHSQTKCTAALHCQLHMCGGHHWQLAQGDWCIVVRPNPLRAYLAAPLRGPCMGLHSSQLIGMHACVHACADVHASMVACIAFNELRLGRGTKGPPLTGWQGVPPRADGLMGCGPVGAHQY